MADKVLILGGSYFVGRKMVEYLAGRGYEATVLNRGTRPLSIEGVRQICCDRNDGEGMKAALAGKVFDYVIDVSWQDVSWVEKLCAALDFEQVKYRICPLLLIDFKSCLALSSFASSSAMKGSSRMTKGASFS